MATDTHDNPWPDWENIPSPQPLQQQRQKSPTGTIGSTNPWASRPATIANLSDAEDEDEIRESAELTGADIWRNEFLARAQTYPEGGSIDWQYEEASVRARKRSQQSQRGLRRLLSPFLEGTRIWIVLILTGLAVGLTGAWLDILVAWLSDLRTGRCKYGFYYNQVACCSGLDAGEVCNEWMTWSEYLKVNPWWLGGPLQWIVFLTSAVVFAGSAGVLVLSYAPFAFHTGIPEIKAILGGFVFDRFLSPMTLLIKGVGLALSVASGLSLGKEGPLVHVSCCFAFLLSGMFKSLRRNEAQKRYILASAAAAGVSVAFGSPLGGVIFGLEELELFTHSSVMWRAFVTSAVAAVSLQYVDPFGTSKLVLFQVQSKDVWRSFELVPWTILAIIGGTLGSFLIKLNVHVAVYRQHSKIAQWPLLEVVTVAAVTAIISHPLVFLRVQASELVANLFAECDPSIGYYGLCDPKLRLWNIALLMMTAGIKLVLTAWTFGIKVPAGIVLPSITIGAALGRAVGLIMESIHVSWPHLWIFASCPPEPGSRCISPGFYSVVGAAAMLGGVTRMTVSLVVILFELTGALSHVLPIMLSVIVSKFVGDAFGKEGIYTAWVQLRHYPSFPSGDFRDEGRVAAHVMVPSEKIFCVGAYSTLQELDGLVKSHSYYGFPVVENGILVGYVTRERLKAAIRPLLEEEINEGSTSYCTFIQHPDGFRGADLSEIVDQAPIQMRKDIPLEIVTATFQKMNIRCVLFTVRGRLVGMLTKRDIVNITTTSRFKGALASST